MCEWLCLCNIINLLWRNKFRLVLCAFRFLRTKEKLYGTVFCLFAHSFCSFFCCAIVVLVSGPRYIYIHWLLCIHTTYTSVGNFGVWQPTNISVVPKVICSSYELTKMNYSQCRGSNSTTLWANIMLYLCIHFLSLILSLFPSLHRFLLNVLYTDLHLRNYKVFLLDFCALFFLYGSYMCIFGPFPLADCTFACAFFTADNPILYHFVCKSTWVAEEKRER